MNQDSLVQAPKAGGKTEKQFREELEALNKEGNELNERRVRIQTEVERARKEKGELEAELLKEFGTSDIDKLSEILIDRESANERALEAYRAGLKSLRAEIDDVTRQLAQVK